MQTEDYREGLSKRLQEPEYASDYLKAASDEKSGELRDMAVRDVLGIKLFDIAEHLKSPEEVMAFLQEVLNTGNESDFIHALETAVRAMKFEIK